jgi:hypothetical protein
MPCWITLTSWTWSQTKSCSRCDCLFEYSWNRGVLTGRRIFWGYAYASAADAGGLQSEVYWSNTHWTDRLSQWHQQDRISWSRDEFMQQQ